jgi:4-amino-4-deoxy-L-arabinose transferase-like glycosyltransferase
VLGAHQGVQVVLTDEGAAGDRSPLSSASVAEDADDSAAPATPEQPRPQRAPLTPTQRRWLAGIVIVAALVRIGWLIYANVDPPTSVFPSGDSYSYWYYGNEIADGNGYISYTTGEATAYYPIGFPALLAGIYWLGEHTPFVDPDLMMLTGVFQVIISVATVALVFVVGRRLAGPRVGLVAAGLMALWPNLIHQVTTIQVETTFIFLTVAALAVIVDHDWSSGPPSHARLLAFGAVLGVSALVRPFSAPLLLGLFLALLAIGLGWRRAAVLTAVPVLVIVVMFTPWTIRNSARFNQFIPSSTNMGDTLCIDRSDSATGAFQWSIHEGCVEPTLNEAARNRGNTRKAVEWVVANPERELLQIVRRARWMFGHDHDGVISTEGLGSGPILSDLSRDLNSSVADWYFRLVFVVGAVGIPLLYRRSPRPERRIVVVIGAALLVIPLLLWGNPRFHQPLVPFMAISAALVAVLVVDRVRAGRPASVAAVPGSPATAEPGRYGIGRSEVGGTETEPLDADRSEGGVSERELSTAGEGEMSDAAGNAAGASEPAASEGGVSAAPDVAGPRTEELAPGADVAGSSSVAEAPVPGAAVSASSSAEGESPSH